MPTVKDVTPYIEQIAQTIRSMRGVQAVYVTGSYLANIDTPTYPIKDIDVIACTDFDSGDLMAIDGGPDSPLKMASTELEDFGFNPDAVKFTQSYIGLKNYGVDHWATSGDGKILHWGPIPESIDEWQEVHEEAEKYAQKVTGYNRMKLTKGCENSRRQWHEAYSASISKKFSRKAKNMGWYPSDHPSTEILANAKLIA